MRPCFCGCKAESLVGRKHDEQLRPAVFLRYSRSGARELDVFSGLKKSYPSLQPCTQFPFLDDAQIPFRKIPGQRLRSRPLVKPSNC